MMPENERYPNANDLVRHLKTAVYDGRITPEQFRERLKTDAERPIDLDMLRAFCDGYEDRLEAYGNMFGTIVEIATDQLDPDSWQRRESEVDGHVARMMAKAPLWKEHILTVGSFLSELRASSGQGPVWLKDLSHATAHLLAFHVRRMAAEGWQGCKQIAHRSRTDPRYHYAASASQLFLTSHMKSLPKPNDLIALMELERAAATRALREGEQRQHTIAARDVEIRTETVNVSGQAVSVASERGDVDAPTSMPETEEPTERVSADEAERRAEAFIKHHEYPGLNALARECGCHPATITKAIARSAKLRQAKAAYELRKAKPAAKPRVAPDASWNAQVDEALRQLIEYAPESTRGKLNTPDMRNHLAKMEPDALATLVEGAKKEAEKRARAASRAPVRAQIRSN